MFFNSYYIVENNVGLETIYIVDASNWTYRFFAIYNLNRRIAGVNIDMSAVYGWMKSLRMSPFKNIAICIDGYPEFSNRWFPSYKGQRVKEPEESLQFSKVTLVKLLTQFGKLTGKNIGVYCSQGQEADQVISSIVHIVTHNVPDSYKEDSELYNSIIYKDTVLKKFMEGAKIEIGNFEIYDKAIVASTDFDLFQLKGIGAGIDISIYGNSISYKDAPLKAFEYIEAKCIPAYKMFMGDVSDRIPRIKTSFKKKEIIAIIKQYFLNNQSIESFISNLLIQNNVYGGNLNSLFNQIIATGQVKQLIANHKITWLTYYSIPNKLSYENYDIQETINHYNLKF